MNKQEFEQEVDVIESKLFQLESLQIEIQHLVDDLRGEKLTKKQEEVLDDFEMELM